MANEKWDLVSALSPDEQAIERFRLQCICPIDGKYGKDVDPMRKYLSADAEWKMCARVQRELLAARVKFGQASEKNLAEVDAALPKLDTLNMALLEKHKDIQHDQLALLEEFGRHVSLETKALLHPGTTSYDILDTARSYLSKEAWNECLRPKVGESIDFLCKIAEKSVNLMQVGRTHLQNTSPISFGTNISKFAYRLAERVEKCDYAFDDLRGTITGIVGTGASIEMVIGKGKSKAFEKEVLDSLGLKPDSAATQIVQKERLADVGNGIVTLMSVLGDFANDVRMMYSSAIQEVTSLKDEARLAGSSADAGKNNPTQYENIDGSTIVALSGMGVLYALIQSDFQRDLRGSVEARYQPQIMIAQAYESFSRVVKVLDQFYIIEDNLAKNLVPVRKSPSEAMTAILRGEPGWAHSKYGLGHDFVKKMTQVSKLSKRPLIDVCLEDPEFVQVYDTLPSDKKDILNGKLENYLGPYLQECQDNVNYARNVIVNRPK
jgi:adenylosuccinate lyase